MKVYYATSTSFKEKDEDGIYEKTANYIGFKVGQKNLKVNKYNPSVEEEADPKVALKTIKHNEKALRESDAFIADISDSSAGLGFQVAMALMEKKPVLILRSKKDAKLTSYNSITTPKAHRGVKYQDYESMEEITQYIDKFIEDAKDKIDTKFILIIPPEIDKYLNWAADFRRMHKAQVVRKAIEREMAKDKDWKDYQKDTDF
jgi:hypothetical protein